eukprot:403336729
MQQINNSSSNANIKVAVRLRPLLRDELNRDLKSTKIKAINDIGQIQVQNEKTSGYKAFRFDKVFNEQTSQKEIFEQTEMNHLINQVVQGFHATLFVYGQTGSGKTFSMEGYKYAATNPQNPTKLLPQIPKTQDENENPGSKISITCSYIQLYNEKIFDLLNTDIYKSNYNKQLDKVPGLKLKWNGSSDDVIIENLFCFDCSTSEDGFQYFWKGLKNKMMASHKMNNSSSRSHCILTFTVQQIDIKNPDNLIVSKLQLVDLAGSERQQTAESNKDAQMLKESIEINKSLFTLRQVITALTDNTNIQQQKGMGGMGLNSQNYNYVPYRESKLTSILRQSLGGNSYTLMIACITPLDDYIDENVSTLNYASRAQNISNVPMINQDPKLKLIQEQKRMIERLQKELKLANDQVKFLNQQKQEQSPHFNDESSNGGKVTINNNYNSNLIAIINNRDGNAQQSPKQLQQELSPINKQSQLRNSILPEIKPQSKTITKNAQEYETSDTNNKQKVVSDKQQQLNVDFQSFIQTKSDALKNLSTAIQPAQQIINQKHQSSNLLQVLQSNLQLREDLLKVSQENEKTQIQNYQMNIENEDLRDRLVLVTNDNGFEIEYQQYLPRVNVEEEISNITNLKQLEGAKKTILSNIFGLRKENRHLLKRIEGYEHQQNLLQLKTQRDGNQKQSLVSNREIQNKSEIRNNITKNQLNMSYNPDDYESVINKVSSDLRSNQQQQQYFSERENNSQTVMKLRKSKLDHSLDQVFPQSRLQQTNRETSFDISQLKNNSLPPKFAPNSMRVSKAELQNNRQLSLSSNVSKPTIQTKSQQTYFNINNSQHNSTRQPIKKSQNNRRSSNDSIDDLQVNNNTIKEDIANEYNTTLDKIENRNIDLQVNHFKSPKKSQQQSQHASFNNNFSGFGNLVNQSVSIQPPSNMVQTGMTVANNRLGNMTGQSFMQNQSVISSSIQNKNNTFLANLSKIDGVNVNEISSNYSSLNHPNTNSNNKKNRYKNTSVKDKLYF